MLFRARQGYISLRPPRNRKQHAQPTQPDHRARFFEEYRKEAEEYDREFMGKFDEDLNTTLIFVSFVWCSGIRVLTRSQAGAASESCPYQTPGSNTLRYLWSRARRMLRSVAAAVFPSFRKLDTVKVIQMSHCPSWSRNWIMPPMKDVILDIPRALATDTHHLGRGLCSTVVVC